MQFSRGERIIYREMAITEQAYSYVMIAPIPPSLSTDSSRISVVVFVFNTAFMNFLNVAVLKMRREPFTRDPKSYVGRINGTVRVLFKSRLG